MDPYFAAPGVTLYHADCLAALRALPDRSVRSCVTSPPYYGLRDYDLPPTEWPAVTYRPIAGAPEVTIPGCDPACNHEWGDESYPDRRGVQLGKATTVDARQASRGARCLRCGGWRGCLGLEETPEAYMGHLVLIFREVRRVLTDDGTLWLNLGDSYANNPSTSVIPRSEQGNGTGIYQIPPEKHHAARRQTPNRATSLAQAGYKKKDLLGNPWRVTFALQEDGWYLRCDVIWHKPNPMPESVRDRPTRNHEYLFLLSKRAKYYYDPEAIKEDASGNTHPKGPKNSPPKSLLHEDARARVKNNGSYTAAIPDVVSSRNKRSVWTISPQQFAGAHFATMPEALVEPCILAGSSERGRCAACGKPWVRSLASNNPSKGTNTGADMTGGAARTGNPQTSAGLHRNQGGVYSTRRDLGFKPSCTCNADTAPDTILDPFCGSGTVGRVARKLGRHFIGIDRSADYCAMAAERITAPIEPPPPPPPPDRLSLFDLMGAASGEGQS